MELVGPAAALPIWREAFFALDWLSLRASPVYYGIGVPRGDGAPVILVPGLLGSDAYLLEMYYWLRRIGYRPYRSGIGRNLECPDILSERLIETVDRAHEETGRRVHLIGHSFGGTIARSVAVRRPQQVAQVITLAAPIREIRAHPLVLTVGRFVRNAVVARRAEEQVKATCYTGTCTCPFVRSLTNGQMAPTVQRLAVYTKTDGMLDWRSCSDEDERSNVEVSGSHVGLVFNPQVYRTIAVSLAEAARYGARQWTERSTPRKNAA